MILKFYSCWGGGGWGSVTVTDISSCSADKRCNRAWRVLLFCGRGRGGGHWLMSVAVVLINLTTKLRCVTVLGKVGWGMNTDLMSLAVVLTNLTKSWPVFPFIRQTWLTGVSVRGQRMRFRQGWSLWPRSGRIWWPSLRKRARSWRMPPGNRRTMLASRTWSSGWERSVAAALLYPRLWGCAVCVLFSSFPSPLCEIQTGVGGGLEECFRKKTVWRNAVSMNILPKLEKLQRGEKESDGALLLWSPHLHAHHPTKQPLLLARCTVEVPSSPAVGAAKTM